MFFKHPIVSMCVCYLLSRVQLFVSTWAVGLQEAPQFMEFSRQEYWRPFPSPGDLPDPGIEPGSPALLEKEMATHSSIFAWKIPWTEEPGRLQSMGSLRVGHD